MPSLREITMKSGVSLTGSRGKEKGDRRRVGDRERKFGFLTHHYRLMRTRLHLPVSIPEVSKFSRARQELKWRRTAYFNDRYQRNGPLWRERFKSQLIEDEAHLYACGRYIEENPVKANLVSQPEDRPHSSAAHYRLGSKDPLADPCEFDPEENTPLPRIDPEMLEAGRATGSELFLLHLEEGLLKEVSVP